MADDVVLNKAASIERCVARALEEYEADPPTIPHIFLLHTNLTPHAVRQKRNCPSKNYVGAEGRKGIEPRAMANQGGLHGRINLAKRPVHSAGSFSSED